MAPDCRFCSEQLEEEGLECNSCHDSFHFRCGTGLASDAPMSRNVSTFLKDCTFKCPLCSIGEKNTLINSVITINQVYNETKHATDFILNATLVGDGDDHVAEGVENADEAAQQPPQLGDAPQPPQPDEPQPPQRVEPPPQRNEPPPPQRNEPPPPRRNEPQPAETGGDGGRAPDPDQFPPSLENEGLATLHEHDLTRAKKLMYILNTLLRLPGHPNTILMGDSHFNHMDGKEVDPDDDQVRVRSVGGLCIPALVFGLAKHKHSYKKIKRVCINIGTNDALHSEQHCLDDRPKYLRFLSRECGRIFPNATISIILPFSGMKGVTTRFIDDLEQDIKTLCPKIVSIRPPNMRNKFSKSGVHLNRAGRKSFIQFLHSKFVIRKQRVFSRDSGRKAGPPSNPSAPAPTYARAHKNTRSAEDNLDFRVRSDSVTAAQLPPTLVQDIATKVYELISNQNMLYRQFPPLTWPR